MDMVCISTTILRIVERICIQAIMPMHRMVHMAPIHRIAHMALTHHIRHTDLTDLMAPIHHMVHTDHTDLMVHTDLMLVVAGADGRIAS